MELRDRATALAEAVRGARSLAAEQVLQGRLNLGHRIVVADEAGADIATIAYRDAVAVLTYALRIRRRAGRTAAA